MSRLLVVDDEANIRLLYAEELADEGYDVVTAAGTAEAVEKLQEGTFDLAVLDIKLKNESGIELLQKLVKERHDMPVILCSAFSCYKDDFSAWLADGYVVKSSDLSELKQEISPGPGQEAQRQKAGLNRPVDVKPAPGLSLIRGRVHYFKQGAHCMKAVIMAGGFGTRIQPLTSSIPKPMIPLMNRPIMLHIVELLKKHDITDLVMLLYHQPFVIKNFFRDGADFGVKITYVTPLRGHGNGRSGQVRRKVPGRALPGHQRRPADRLQPARRSSISMTTTRPWPPSPSPRSKTRSSSGW